jgi:hypothetical protein
LEATSENAQYLSYARPVIGCADNHTSLSLTECIRNPTSNVRTIAASTLNLITVIGTNFGASGASIYIGNSACTDVTHDVNNPHQQLTFTLPNGNRLNLALVLFQRNGELSQTPVSISYSQCQPGITEEESQPLL